MQQERRRRPRSLRPIQDVDLANGEGPTAVYEFAISAAKGRHLQQATVAELKGIIARMEALVGRRISTG